MYFEAIGPGPRIGRWQYEDIVRWEDWTFEKFQALGSELECPILIRFFHGNSFRFAAIIKEIYFNSKIELRLQRLDDGKEEVIGFDKYVRIEQAITKEKNYGSERL